MLNCAKSEMRNVEWCYLNAKVRFYDFTAECITIGFDEIPALYGNEKGITEMAEEVKKQTN